MSDEDTSDNSNPTIPGGPPSGLTSRFRMTGKLGAGGMGDVYLAEDLQLKRLVALKTIRPDLCRNTEVRKRIERECLLHAKIGSHPHIVTLYDRLETGGQINLVMEYVEGETLQELLDRNARQGIAMVWKDCLDITTQVLEALACIHAHGIVHRDIKPSNILLAQDDAGGYCAKLMDFGIARLEVDDDSSTALTKEGGSGPGTPTYMAPEQIDPPTFGPVSHATDVYAMGIMLYQILSGKPPFTGGVTEVFCGHLNRPPAPLDSHGDTTIPPAVAEILDCALAKEPSQRFPSAKSFRDELARLVLPESAGARMAPREIPGPSSSKDTSKTIATGDIEAATAHREATQLGTATGSRNKGRRFLAAIAVLLLVTAAFGAYMAYTALRADSASDSSPVQQEDTETESATEPEAVADPHPDETPAAQPSEPASTAPAPPVAPAVSTSIPQPAAAATPPLPPEAPPNQPADVTSDSGQGGSALEELLRRRSQSQTDEPAPKPKSKPKPAPKPEPKPEIKPAPTPTPEPEPAPEPKPQPVVKSTPAPTPAPAPAPEPEVKPAPEPEPEAKPAPPAEPAPADGDGWTVIRKEDRKVE